MPDQPVQYQMIGSDGVEYGPASATEVAEWIYENRASMKTLVRRIGEPNWRNLGEFPEFNDAFAAKAKAQPAITGTIPVEPEEGPPKNKFARLSFTLSVASLLCFICLPLTPVALAMSAVSLYRIKKGKDPAEGLRFALAGIGISITVLIANLVLIHYVPRFFGQ